LRSGGDYLVYRLNPGFGLAYESRLLGLCYAMMETELHVGGALDGSYSAGVGGSVGLVRNLTDRWKVATFARDVYHALGDSDNLITAGVGQSLRVHPDMSVSLELSGEWNDRDSALQSTVYWNAFF
jgi:hypothetical protein